MPQSAILSVAFLFLFSTAEDPSTSSLGDRQQTVRLTLNTAYTSTNNDLSEIDDPKSYLRT